jgi:hypothetical protein
MNDNKIEVRIREVDQHPASEVLVVTTFMEVIVVKLGSYLPSPPSNLAGVEINSN